MADTTSNGARKKMLRSVVDVGRVFGLGMGYRSKLDSSQVLKFVEWRQVGILAVD